MRQKDWGTRHTPVVYLLERAGLPFGLPGGTISRPGSPGCLARIDQAVQRAVSGQPPPRSQVDYCSTGPPPFFGATAAVWAVHGYSFRLAELGGAPAESSPEDVRHLTHHGR